MQTGIKFQPIKFFIAAAIFLYVGFLFFGDAGHVNSVTVPQNSDYAIVGPYDTATSGTGNWSYGGGVPGYSYFFTFGHKYRIRQTGTISRVKIYTYSTTSLTGFYINIWRSNGSTYDLVGTSNNIVSSLVAGDYATIDLSSPITGVQEGDYYGYKIEASDATHHFFAKTGVSNVTSYFVSNSTPTSTNYNWGAQTAAAGSVLPIEFYMQAPKFVFIGDSIMSGAPAHLSFIDTSANDTTDLDSTIEYQFAALGSYTFQNMGIGGQTSTQISARFTDDVINLSPSAVVIEAGVNDIANSGLKSTFISNWTSMLDAAQASSKVSYIFVLKILPWSNGTNTQMQTRDDWNASLVTLVASYSKAYVVDASSYVGQFRAGGDAGNLWDIQAAYNSDGVHFNAAGHGQIAQAIYDTLNNSVLQISSSSPADNATGVAVSSDISVTFNEAVTAQSSGANTITIKKSSDNSTVETITADSAQVTGSGTATITINPTSNFLPSTSYYVQMGSNAFKNAGGNNFLGISDTTTWNFTTTPPSVFSLSPADNATGVTISDNLVITFNEAVTAQSSGANTITIKKSSNNSTVETITADSAQVTGSGTATITINPTSNLLYSTSYYVQIGSNAFKNAAGDAYAGISNTTTWNFSTANPPTNGYTYYKTITISNDYMDAVLTDFPLYVHLSADANIGDATLSSGYDVIFSSSDGGALLSFERSAWAGGAGADATADFWVKTTLNSDNNTTTDDTIRIYYGNASATDTQNAANVWDSNFKGVWHLENSSLTDSIGGNNGTATGDATNVAGKISNGYNLAGTNSSKISMTKHADIAYANPITVSFWAKNNTAESLKGLINVEAGSVSMITGYFGSSFNGFVTSRKSVATYDAKPSSAITQTNWNYFTITNPGGDTALSLYMNGVSNSTTTNGGLGGFGSDVIELGNGFNSTYHANMVADELRVSNIVRSAAWIKFDYHNQADVGNNITFGEQTSAFSSEKMISSFDFSSPEAVGVVNDTNHTVAITVPSGTNVTSLTPTIAVSPEATISPLSGVAQNFTNPVTYTVTAQDSSTQEYIVTVTVAASTDSTLSDLTISSGTLTPSFASGTTSYTDSVANGITSVTVTPTANQANATITVNNVAVNSGSASGSISLNVGSNTISVVVTAQDTVTTSTYTISVTRAGSSSKAITAFSIPQGDGVINGTNIAISVPYGTDVTSVVATFTTTGSSVAVGAVTQTSGVTSNNFTSPVTYTVTAQDSSTQEYIVTVTVAASTDSTLSNLTISSGTLTPSFTSGTTSYTDSVTNGTTSVTVTPTANQANATITVNGTAVSSGSASGSISLNVGSNTISVVITAQDATTTDTYTITVTRATSVSSSGAGAPYIPPQPAKTATQQVQQKIQELIIKVNYIKSQIQTWLGQNQVESPVQITKTLTYGDTGEEVILLQNKLKQFGFFPSEIKSNGNFGPATLKSVQNFQLKNKIVSPSIYGYGIVGPRTRQALNALAK